MMKIKNNNKLNTYKKLDKYLNLIIYLLLTIPAILFFAFWTKWYIALISISIIIFCLYKIFKNFESKNNYQIEDYENLFNIKRWIVIVALLLTINIFSGSGGIMYQNWDYNARNAVMHDLIDYDWPVKYHYEEDDLIREIIGEDGRLSYYFSYWLPGAAIGKITNFHVANMITFIYQFLLLISFYYLLSRILKKNRIWYLLIFCCFSGLDIIGGYFINSDFGFTLGSHIDTWGSPFSYSSNITQLFWVFNQAIPSWIITLLFLNDKSFKNIGILMILSLLFSPFPSIGFTLIILYYLILGFTKSKILNRIKEALSINNILSIFPFIIIALFYINNTSSQPKGLILNTGVSIGTMFIAMFFEFILLSIICINKNTWKYIFANTACLVICSQFYLGIGNDFVNRTTIPLLLVLLLFAIDNFINYQNQIKIKLLVMYFTLSSITTLSEFYRTYDFYQKNGIFSELNLNDNWKTYGKTLNEDAMRIYIKNFSSSYKNNFLDKYIFK